MSKIRNSVYGLALGDSIAYQTEFKGFQDAVSYHENYGIAKNQHLLVTDDTQMSIALVDGIRDTILNRDEKPLNLQLLENVAKEYVLWSESPENYRAPGNACMQALKALSKHINETKNYDKYRELIKNFKEPKERKWTQFGDDLNYNSKGSGTVMRAPWLALAAPIFENEEQLREFSNFQARITHGHPTAVLGAWLTTKLSLDLLHNKVGIGDLREYALDYVENQILQENNYDWYELKSRLEDSLRLVNSTYKHSHLYEIDPSGFIGSGGTAENVLITALILIDSFGDDPFEVIQRSMVSSGDSDTIGAVAGGMLGIAYDEPIWDTYLHLIEPNYVERLENSVSFLESLNT